MKGPISPARDIPPERTRFKLTGRSIRLDSRIHAARGDLADIALAGTLFSAHYAQPVEMTCVAAGAPLLSGPTLKAAAVSELLRGESFHALDMTTDWAWGCCGHDGYVGYIRRDAIDVRELTGHRIVTGTAPLFSAPDIKSPILDYWPRGARFAGESDGAFLACAEGFIHTRHAAPLDNIEQDWTAAAARYLGTPYVWGGRGHRGIDCSGLVQQALEQCGIAAPRDTDMQREALGDLLAPDEAPARGDLIFFPGHVGIMADESNLLHANAHWMATVIEPLADVIDRLAPDHDMPVLARRRIVS